jgi:bilirubin oxidase
VALKDVVWLNTNEQVNVIARYAPWDGFYMFHCHNLDHEMMAAFNVTALTDLGYDEKTSFIDPMEARYRSKHFSDSDLTSRSGDFADSAIQAKVGFFNGLEAYRNKAGVESALEQYWATKSSSTVAPSSTNGGKASSTLATVVTTGSSAAGSSAAAAGSSAVASSDSAAAGTSSATAASSTA